MRTVRTQFLRSAGCLFGAAVLALPGLLQAQPSAHYPPGVEGIKAASLPPPGIYVRDYNYCWFADTLNDPHGDKASLPGETKAFVYANIPRVIWITDLEVLGGNIGVDALLPLQYTHLEINAAHLDDSTFGIGDFAVEGTWSKHIKQFDFALGYGVFAPTGDSDPINHPTWAGQGYWTHLLTAGATWYVDADKTWALSALNRFEINHEQDKTDITKGDVYTLEWGLSKTLVKTVEVGAVGYYQQKVTSDSGSSAALRDRVAAVGPEIGVFCPHLGVNTSLRYLYEFMSEDRFQGHTIALVFTKRL
jgi:hypothetical protein